MQLVCRAADSSYGTPPNMVESMSKDTTLTPTNFMQAAEALLGLGKSLPLLCFVVSQRLKIRKLPSCAARLMQLAGIQSSPPARPVVPHYTVQQGTCTRQVMHYGLALSDRQGTNSHKCSGRVALTAQGLHLCCWSCVVVQTDSHLDATLMGFAALLPCWAPCWPLRSLPEASCWRQRGGQRFALLVLVPGSALRQMQRVTILTKVVKLLLHPL